MIVGNRIFSNVPLLARQSMLMLTELPGMVTMFERVFLLEYSESYTCNFKCMMMPELRGITTVYATGSAFETLLALYYNSFILTVGIIGVAIYSIEGRGKKYLILLLEIYVVTVIVKGHVYCWKLNPCIN